MNSLTSTSSKPTVPLLLWHSDSGSWSINLWSSPSKRTSSYLHTTSTPLTSLISIQRWLHLKRLQTSIQWVIYWLLSNSKISQSSSRLNRKSNRWCALSTELWSMSRKPKWKHCRRIHHSRCYLNQSPRTQWERDPGADHKVKSTIHWVWTTKVENQSTSRSQGYRMRSKTLTYTNCCTTFLLMYSSPLT